MSDIITLENVKFTYKNRELPTLDINKLSIRSGERVFIHGPSGSGKSTLLNLISGVIRPDQGKVMILGEEISSYSPSKTDRFRGLHIGYIFQGFNLIDYLTIDENIVLRTKVSKEKNKLNQRDLDARIKSITSRLSIDEFLNSRVADLSVGQQQRVAVARALISSPEILIADEPTSALDDDIANSFMELLIEEQEISSFTLLFVSHDKRLSKFFNKTIAINDFNQKRVYHD